MGMDFKEIALRDREYFNRFLRMDNPQISELTFTNMFMWRNFYKFRYAQVGDMLVLISVPDEGIPFAFAPFGRLSSEGFKDIVLMLWDYFKKNNWKMVFGRVPESILPFFKELFKDKAEIKLDEANSDYVYSSKDLISLVGKKYDGKRNHIHKFKRLYEYSYEKVDASNISECKRIMDEWCAEKDCKDHNANYCENKANMELLNNIDELGCKGALISVNGRYEAFTIGEMLNDNTAVIHVEKANSKVNGLYTITNQQFCENEWGHVEYINREQDLGIEGIRKAKLSYHPVKMINKYLVEIE
ncbi:DUF2156 domain-containing protein [Pseudobacteroides cellulosolvens]|uniref:DUF2156 domain-containing protein n=1 Tax=Pseudobacteroides cellulosolvens TaxID=35825 RepID=UPI000567186F|nr:phosphatidylglycerol lysyltransferase domain-containing protein [Pseudobacteroides cellulosolvens]